MSIIQCFRCQYIGFGKPWKSWVRGAPPVTHSGRKAPGIYEEARQKLALP